MSPSLGNGQRRDFGLQSTMKSRPIEKKKARSLVDIVDTTEKLERTGKVRRIDPFLHPSAITAVSNG
jgi:hypothetical protein